MIHSVQMARWNGRDEGGGNIRKDRKEGRKQDILAECGGWVSGQSPGSRRTAGGRRGNRDQFCQNWVHTPGATELGWPTERVRGGGGGAELGVMKQCCYLYHFILD